MTKKQMLVMGVFQDQQQAQQAVNELRSMGLAEDQVALIGRNSQAAECYRGEFGTGHFLVTARAGRRGAKVREALRRLGASDIRDIEEATTARTIARGRTEERQRTMHAGETEQTIPVREEELHVEKQPVKRGEVRVRKDIQTERRELDVPVTKEEVVIERRPVEGRKKSARPIGAGEEIRVPVHKEQVHLEKEPVVKEEVTVGKRKVRDRKNVAGTVRKEQVRVETEGDADVRHTSSTRSRT